VDAVMKQASDAGATVVKRPQDTFFGGYAGYFLDPDRHLWRSYGIPSCCRRIDAQRALAAQVSHPGWRVYVSGP
jgi:hypothetical protein